LIELQEVTTSLTRNQEELSQQMKKLADLESQLKIVRDEVESKEMSVGRMAMEVHRGNAVMILQHLKKLAAENDVPGLILLTNPQTDEVTVHKSELTLRFQ
jgi:arginine utilization protein RocB